MSKKFSIKSMIAKILNEEQKTFYYLAPDIVGSISNANLNKDKKEFSIDFITTSGQPTKLTTSDECFYNWTEDNKKQGEGNLVRDFLMFFLGNARPVEKKEKIMDEIVDEFNNIISDDMPSNATNTLVGKSNFDTDRVIKQTTSMNTKFFRSDYGYGTVTWTLLLFSTTNLWLFL